MALKVYWTEFAEQKLEEIFEYYKMKANYQVAKNLVDSIYNKVEQLKNQPKIGQVEELLNERKEGFRYLVYKNYKIIYWINSSDQRIEINDIFDTRQNPIKIKRY